MPDDDERSLVDRLAELGFARCAHLDGRDLRFERDLARGPVVYVAVADGSVFMVGETGDHRTRFKSYQRWFALPDDSRRRDLRARNLFMEMTGGVPVDFYSKEPMTIRSDLTQREYSLHRVEESIFIDYFRPAWNTRPGGRKRG